MAFSKLSSAALTAAVLLSSISEAAPASLLSPSRRAGGLKFDFGGEKIRGVNLGGWFVLEPWITPSIFEACPENVVDEYTMSETLGKDEMSKRMQEHWSSWITEDDFAEIAGSGLNFVRIPIGYWSVSPVDGDPYIQGAYEWLGKSLDWASSNGLKVMIDLHGAPGSQNGFDNSGRKGSIEWTQGDTVDQTLKALKQIRDDHASHPAVASIELLNEPMGSSLDLDTVTQFYYDGWGAMKDSSVAVTFHEAFEGCPEWDDFGGGMDGLMCDTHHYEVFDSEALEMGVEDHISTACQFGDEMAGVNKWTISGEWTGAMTDCAKWLNGRGEGARYDGTYEGSYYIGSCEGKATGTVAGLSEEDKRGIAAFIQAQIVAYEKADGWIFWTWRNEAAPEWHLRELMREGVVNLNNINTAICGGGGW